MTAAQMRKLALSMPEAEEKEHFGKPDFRVRNKIFAGLSADGKRGTLKLTPEIQALMLEAKPRAFTPCEGAWGCSGWTYVHFAEVDAAHVRDLVAEAWRLVAPKSLIKDVASTPRESRGGPKARSSKAAASRR